MSRRVTDAVLICSSPSMGVTCRFSKGSSRPVTSSHTVRRAASITPPVTPKMSAAPVDRPSGASNVPSGSARRSMPADLIIRASSRVVSTASTSGTPSRLESSGRWISYFLAVQGMTETTKRSFGSTPSFSA